MEKKREFIAALYKELYEMMVTYGIKLLENPEQIEEAIQETFRIACQKVDEVMKHENPRGWLVTTLRNVIRNMNRSRYAAAQLLADYVTVKGEQITYTRDRHNLDVTLCGIADMEEFKLVKEMAVDGKSHLEIAAERGISVDACKKRMQRAKEVLRKKLK